MKTTIHILLLQLICLASIAQNIQFTAKTNRTKVGTGETFQISYTINGNGSDFKAPTISDFKIVGGPNQSSSVQIINGSFSQNLSFSYYLAPIKEGVFKIKPASIKVDGKIYQSNELSIEVVKGAPAQNQTQAQNKNQSNQRNQGTSQSSDDISDYIFLKVSVDKTNVFLGEQITATYKVYYRVNIRDYAVNKVPSLNGFWSQDLSEGNNSKSYTENIDGVVYHVSEVKKSVLFPQRSGTLELDPLEMDFVIQRQSNRRAQSIYDLINPYEDVKYSLKTQALKITVLPLPEGDKPKDFAGAVGHYSFDAKINKTDIKANEAINLTLTVSGKGNLKLIENPKPIFPADFEVYDPKISEKINTSGSGVSGSVTYEYVLIPRHSGKFTFEPLSFSYFNPETRQYQTLKSQAFEINVAKGTEESVMVSGTNKEDIKLIGSDIRFIKTETDKIRPIGSFFFGSGLFYLLIFLPVLLLIGFVIFWKDYSKNAQNHAWMKSRKANKIASHRLAIAKKYLEKNETIQFYEELSKALYGYLGDKFNIPIAELSKEHIRENLSIRNISQQEIDKTIKTLDHCEYARFAPVNSNSEKEIYNEAERLINIIETEAGKQTPVRI